MNSKKIFTLLLALGLLGSCDQKKDEPQVNEQPSEGFTIEAEASADDLGLRSLRSALKFQIQKDENITLDTIPENFKTHAFFRHRLKPEILGYAPIEWKIIGYDTETKRLRLRFSTKNLKVEKIGSGYDPANKQYLTIKANEHPSDNVSRYWVWYVAGVMGAHEELTNEEKRTGRVHFGAMTAASQGSSISQETRKDKDGRVTVLTKEVTHPIHAPLVSTYVKITPDYESNPQNLEKGRIGNWVFRAKGMMLRLKLNNRTDIDLNNAPIHLTSPDNSLVGDIYIGFGQQDVRRVDLHGGASDPKVILGTSTPIVKVTQKKRTNVSHMLWAISKNSNNETPAGVKAFITPSGIGEMQLGRQRPAAGHAFVPFLSSKPIRNNSSWLFELDFKIQ